MGSDILAPKATGCLVQGDDIPRVCASISAYGAQFGCGAGTALLGLTFPHLLEKFHLLASNLGIKVFTCAGVGLIIGLVLSYQIRQTVIINLSKISLACFSIFIASCLQLLVMISDDINLICLLYILQFTAFGCVEGFTLTALFEMWGQRIQPWIYSKTLSFSFGCVVLSLFFRNKRFNEIYFLSAVMCFFPLFGLLADYIYTHYRNKNIRNNSTIINHYSTFGNETSSPSFHRSLSTPPLSRMLPNRDTIPTILEEDFMSSECVLLELAFEHVSGLTSVPSKVKTAVINILDATEYCNVSIQQRKDPYFEPRIIKTLSYVTKPIVNKLNDFKIAKKIPPIPLIPPIQALWIASFGFLSMCLVTIFIGWMPWYVIEYNQSVHEENNPYLNHWNVMSLYYAFTLIGAVSSIPLSIWISTTTIFRIHLTFLLLSSISFAKFTFSLNSFHYFLYGSVFLGIALSSTSSSLLTILNDSGYTCDDLSITFISIFTSLGMIVSSILIAYSVSLFGPHSVPAICSIFGICFLLSYLFFYCLQLPLNRLGSSLSYQHLDSTPFKSFNTYQRAQTMLGDKNKIFKFSRSSGDLTLLYQCDQSL